MSETSQEFWARWRREEEEEKQSGERCRKCGQYIFCIQPPGHSRLCWNCKSLDTADEVRCNRYIRCPKCRHNWNPFDGDGYWENGLLGEGEHDVDCPGCGHAFEVTTNVAYSFDSPTLITEEAEEEAEEGGDVGREPPAA